MVVDSLTSPSAQPAGAVRRRGGTLRLLGRSRLGLIGLSLVAAFALLAVAAPVIVPYDPLQQTAADALQTPSRRHLLGTDQLGRDVFSRVLAATRISMSVGVVAAIVGMLIGVPIGLVSGYVGRWVDELLMRAMDALYALPSILLAMGIVAAIGPGARNLMIAVGVTASPVFARLVRGQVLSVRETEYIQAARALGAGSLRIVALHIFPNVSAPIIVQGSLAAGFAVLAEASLSFLGVGIRPPTPTWGKMLQEGFPLITFNPWLSLAPGLAISLLVLGLNFLGDALRDVLDPRLRTSLALREG